MKIPAFPLIRLSILVENFSAKIPFHQSTLRWRRIHRLFIYAIFLFFVDSHKLYRIIQTQIFFCEPGNFYAPWLNVWIVSTQFRSAVCSCVSCRSFYLISLSHKLYIFHIVNSLIKFFPTYGTIIALSEKIKVGKLPG